jgi:nucleoside-diphosphate-sugar epimerase
MVRCDVIDASGVAQAMQGVDTVIHCAMSDGPSIVEGTRNLLQAAREARVKKVVHLSTGDVYSATSGTVAEDGAQELVGDWYSDAKRRAEATCREFAATGMPLTWLRPGIVYGPFCYAWTQRIGLRLAAGQVALLPEVRNGICNAVFVDDVVEACVNLRRPGQSDGEAFNINGPDLTTWNAYFTAFASALRAPALKSAAEGRTSLKSTLLQPARAIAKALLKRYQKPIMAIYARDPLANRLMKGVEAAFRATPEARELAVYARKVRMDDRRLRAALPHLTSTSLDAGLKISAEYLRRFGLID